MNEQTLQPKTDGNIRTKEIWNNENRTEIHENEYDIHVFVLVYDLVCKISISLYFQIRSFILKAVSATYAPSAERETGQKPSLLLFSHILTDHETNFISWWRLS